MRRIATRSLTGAIGVAVFTFAVGNASAAIVCNANGDCWHARERYDYPREAGIMVHPDNWAWSKGAHYRWREHLGRGYWRGGAWIEF